MRICQYCQKTFPNKIKTNGIIMDLHTRIYCLDCSPYKSGKTKHLKVRLKKVRKCILCKETKSISCFYQRRKVHRTSFCIDCCFIYSGVKTRRMKQKLVNYKGGKCQKCGYCKSLSGLQFHHRDPSQKKFNICGNRLRLPFEKLVIEADKCDLLCANCHDEEHDERFILLLSKLQPIDTLNLESDLMKSLIR